MRRDPLGREAAPARSVAPTPPEASAGPIDDYQIDREPERVGPPLGTRILRVLLGALLIVLAAISIALCWVVGMLLHLF